MNKVLKMRVMKMIKKNFFLQFFVSGDRIQKLFFAKKKKKMMSLSVFVSRQMVEAKGFRMWKFVNEHLVDIQGTNDAPFFNGKDVCKILGYVNAKKAPQEHFDEDTKNSLSEL